MSSSNVSWLTAFERRFPGQLGYFYAFCFNISLVFGHLIVQKLSLHIKPIQSLHWIGVQLIGYNYTALRYMGISPYGKTIKTTKLLLLRGVIGLISSFLLLTGLVMLPLSEAVVIQMTSPVFTAILAVFILKETYSATLALTTLFSFLGVILISKPELIFGDNADAGRYPNKTLGIVISLFASFVAAGTQIMVKILGAVSNAYTISLYLGVIMSVWGAVFELFIGINAIFFVDILWGLLLGFLRFIMHVTLNKSYALEDASKVSLIMYSQVPLAYMIDVFIVGVELDRYSVIGSVSVFSCVFVLLYRNYQAKKAQAQTVKL